MCMVIDLVYVHVHVHDHAYYDLISQSKCFVAHCVLISLLTMAYVYHNKRARYNPVPYTLYMILTTMHM